MSSLIKTMSLSKIKVNRRFKRTHPHQYKLDKVRDYYNLYRRLDKPITINEDRILVDGYTRYLVAKEKNIAFVDVVVSNSLVHTEKEIFTEQNKDKLDYSKKEYVVGVFPNVFYNKGRKEYVWINKKELLIDIGDTIRVKCCGQDGKIFTTNVIVVDKFWSTEELNHRSITKVIKKAS